MWLGGEAVNGGGIQEDVLEFGRGIEEVSGFRGGEGFAGVETPGDGGVGDFCFAGGLHVANFIADVEHFPGFDGEGFPNGAEVAGFSGEF